MDKKSKMDECGSKKRSTRRLNRTRLAKRIDSRVDLISDSPTNQSDNPVVKNSLQDKVQARLSEFFRNFDSDEDEPVSSGLSIGNQCLTGNNDVIVVEANSSLGDNERSKNVLKRKEQRIDEIPQRRGRQRKINKGTTEPIDLEQCNLPEGTFNNLHSDDDSTEQVLNGPVTEGANINTLCSNIENSHSSDIEICENSIGELINECDAIVAEINNFVTEPIIPPSKNITAESSSLEEIKKETDELLYNTNTWFRKIGGTNKPTNEETFQKRIQCPICLEDIGGELQAVTTTCGHLFCKNCITANLKVNKKCPTCRKNLAKKNIIPIFI